MAYKITDDDMGGFYNQNWNRGSQELRFSGSHVGPVHCKEYTGTPDTEIEIADSSVVEPMPEYAMDDYEVVGTPLSSAESTELDRVLELSNRSGDYTRVSSYLDDSGWKKTSGYFFFSAENGNISIEDSVNEELSRIRELTRKLDPVRESDSAWAQSQERERLNRLSSSDQEKLGDIRGMLGRESIKKQITDITDQIERIVQSGGRVGLTDPLSRKLKVLKSRL